MKTSRILPKTEEIVRTRVLMGKNQADIAALAGVPAATVSRVERGFDVTAPTAAGLCRALGREFDELFEIRRPGGVADKAG